MKLGIIVLAVAITPVFSNYAFATEARERGRSAQSVEVGNALCPVSGASVKSMGGGATYEYEGRVYNICCSGCANAFKKDPKKYSAIAEKNATQGGEHGK